MEPKKRVALSERSVREVGSVLRECIGRTLLVLGVGTAAAVSITCSFGGDLPERVKVAAFYSPVCGECREFVAEVLPRIRSTFGDLVSIEIHDVTIPAEYKVLLEYEEACGVGGSGDGLTVFVGEQSFDAPHALNGDLESFLEGAVLESDTEMSAGTGPASRAQGPRSRVHDPPGWHSVLVWAPAVLVLGGGVTLRTVLGERSRRRETA